MHQGASFAALFFFKPLRVEFFFFLSVDDPHLTLSLSFALSSLSFFFFSLPSKPSSSPPPTMFEARLEQGALLKKLLDAVKELVTACGGVVEDAKALWGPRGGSPISRAELDELLMLTDADDAIDADVLLGLDAEGEAL